MNPILIAGIFGLAKGLLGKTVGTLSQPERADVQFRAPVIEETLFRKLPYTVFGKLLPSGYTAAGFALAHLADERLSGPQALARFADVFAGGLIYERAYRNHGWLGSIAAHVAHNFAVGVGEGARSHTVCRRRRGRR